jgi:hypothetical protein
MLHLLHLMLLQLLLLLLTILFYQGHGLLTGRAKLAGARMEPGDGPGGRAIVLLFGERHWRRRVVL